MDVKKNVWWIISVAMIAVAVIGAAWNGEFTSVFWAILAGGIAGILSTTFKK